MPNDTLNLDTEVILDQVVPENEEEQATGDETNPDGTPVTPGQGGQPRAQGNGNGPQGNGAQQPNQDGAPQGQGQQQLQPGQQEQLPGQQGAAQNLGEPGVTAGLGEGIPAGPAVGPQPTGPTGGFGTGGAPKFGGGNASFGPAPTLGGDSGFGSASSFGGAPSGFSGPTPQDTFNNFTPTVDTLSSTNQTEVTGLTNDEFQQVSQDVANRGDVQAREQTDLTQNDFDSNSLTATENTDLTGDNFGVGGAGPNEDNPLDLTGDFEEFLPPVFDDDPVDFIPEDDFIPGDDTDPIVAPPLSSAINFIVTDDGIFEDHGYQGSYQEGIDVEITVDQVDWTADDITVHFEGFAEGLTLDLNGFDSGDRIEVDFDKFLQKISYQWGEGFDFAFDQARYLELEPGWGAAYSKWTLEGDPVSLALTSHYGAAGVKLNVNGNAYVLASTENGANLDFIGNGTSMEQIFLGTNPGDTNGAAFDFIINPHAPRFYIVGEDGKYYLDTDQDNVLDDGDTEVRFPEYLDFSKGQNSILFQGLPSASGLELSGFGRDDRINLDVEALISSLSLDDQTLYQASDETTKRSDYSQTTTTVSRTPDTYYYSSAAKKHYGLLDAQQNTYLGLWATLTHWKSASGNTSSNLYLALRYSGNGRKTLFHWSNEFPEFLNFDHFTWGNTGNEAAAGQVMTELFGVIDFLNYPAPDTTAPTLTSSSPVDDATEVAAGSDITLTFDENIALGSGNISLVQYGTLNTITIDVTNHGGQLSITDNVLTINLTNDLEAEKGYYMYVPDGAIEDTSGNAFAGIAAGDLDFTVKAAPQVTTTEFVVSFNGLIYEHDGNGGYVDLNTTYSVDDVNSMFADNAVSIVFSQAPASKLMLDGFTADDKILVNMLGFQQAGTGQHNTLIYDSNFRSSMTSRSFGTQGSGRLVEKYSHAPGTGSSRTYKATLALYGGGHLGFNAQFGTGQMETRVTHRAYKTLASIANVTFVDDMASFQNAMDQGNSAIVDFVSLGSPD